MYIYEHNKWPNFTFDSKEISLLVEKCHFEQGKLLSRMELIGLTEKEGRILETITSDIIKSSEIEGCILNKEQVRSSVARRLGIQIADSVSSDRNTEAIVEMMLDANLNYQNEMTKERLFGWHACLFPTGYSGMIKIDVGQYRKNPMQVISGSMGKEKIHYEAPSPDQVPFEMKGFLNWIDNALGDSLVIAAIAHLWFVTIHPFDDGNGRIARAITDMLLCRSDGTSQRFYSVSAEILKKKNDYYSVLEKTQKGDLDITEWIKWFLDCVLRAIIESNKQIDSVLEKYLFLQSIENIKINERQRIVLNKLLSPNWVGVLNTSKWAKLTQCSSDTALRDITDLVKKGILQKDSNAGGRSTNYLVKKDLVKVPIRSILSQ